MQHQHETRCYTHVNGRAIVKHSMFLKLREGGVVFLCPSADMWEYTFQSPNHEDESSVMSCCVDSCKAKHYEHTHCLNFQGQAAIVESGTIYLEHSIASQKTWLFRNMLCKHQTSHKNDFNGSPIRGYKDFVSFSSHILINLRIGDLTYYGASSCIFAQNHTAKAKLGHLDHRQMLLK
jgi:hypothetical protein